MIKTLTGSPVSNVDSLDGWDGTDAGWSADQSRDSGPSDHWYLYRRPHRWSGIKISLVGCIQMPLCCNL